jgi:hypothetical protein
MKGILCISRPARHRAWPASAVSAPLPAAARPTTAFARAARTAAFAAALAVVVPAFADTAEDIRDIRGPKSVPGSSLLPAVLAGAIFVALCAYFLWRRRDRGTPRRVLTLSEQTLERLEETKPLMLPATAREFGIAASEVIRNYIEKRFNVIATQRTTEEFLQTLLQSSNETLTHHRALLAEFLQQCDFVKFAGASLAVTDMESLFQSARSFVLETSEPQRETGAPPPRAGESSREKSAPPSGANALPQANPPPQANPRPQASEPPRKTGEHRPT